MAMDNALSEHRFKLYEYICDKLEITCNSKTYPIEDIQITGIYLERNYDTDNLPVFMMDIIMSDELYYNICTHHDDTKFTMTFKSQISESESEKTAGSIYINGSFIPMELDGTPFHSQQLFDEMKSKSTTGETSTLLNFSNSRTFILCSEKQLKATKHRCNCVLTSASMLDAVAVLLSESGAVKPLVSPFDNNSKYSELILLPQQTIPQLKYLNGFFGFYKEGAQIFFDFDYTYILRNTAKCTAYVKDEIQNVVFCIYDTSYGDTTKIGSKRDIKTKTAYIGLSSVNFTMDDLSKAANEYMGTNATIINVDGSVSNATSGNGDSYSVLSVTSHNNYIASETSLRLKELSCVVYLNLQNVDLSLLTPNKTFRIMSTDTNITKKVSGLFRLVSVQVTFIKSGNKYNTSTMVQLKRTDT